MRQRLPGILRPQPGGVESHPCSVPLATTAVDSILELGPFVVRRFVDFALTESMMCRCHA